MVKHRNIFFVYILLIITFGIYGIYWFVSTKNEFNSLGAKVPTAWLLIIPFVNIYWMFKYIQGFAQQVKQDNNTALWFILTIFVGFIMPGIIQSTLNKKAQAAMPVQQAVPTKPAAPMQSTQQPAPQPMQAQPNKQ